MVTPGAQRLLAGLGPGSTLPRHPHEVAGRCGLSHGSRATGGACCHLFAPHRVWGLDDLSGVLMIKDHGALKDMLSSVPRMGAERRRWKLPGGLLQPRRGEGVWLNVQEGLEWEEQEGSQEKRPSGTRPGSLDGSSLPRVLNTPLSLHVHIHTQHFKKIFYSVRVNSVPWEPNSIGSNLGLTFYGLCDPGQVT